VRRRPLLLAPAAWLATRPVLAQERARRVGVLSISGVSAQQAEMSAYFQVRLQQAGWEVGRNLLGEVRYAEGDLARAQTLAEQLAAGHPDLLIGFGNDAIAALQRAARGIPIVMGFGHEPVAAGFVQGLARPGTRITGTVWVAAEFAGKTLQLLKQAVPRARRVAALGPAQQPGLEPYQRELQDAARRLEITLLPQAVSRPEDVPMALERIAAKAPDALYVAPDGATEVRAGEIAAFALRQRLPSLGLSHTLVANGCLLYYGADIREVLARTASFVDRILRGADPATLPVEQPSRFTLTVNARTARAIGHVLPAELLLRADEVID
jgi:putative tryptophan/tyrosine transport system substrate-binding protein